MPVSDSKLVPFRVRFYIPGAAWLTYQDVKAIDVNAAREWAEEQYDPMWDVEIYDITQLG